MQDVVIWYRDNLNYGTITLLMAIESSFIPFPSEIVIPPAAYFSAHNGDLNIFLIVAFATMGALVGAIINYVLALFIGRPLIHAFAESRFGHICMLSSQKVTRAEEYFDKHGAISTFLGRLIPAVRQLISIPAGLARMSLLPFVLFTALGAGIWNAVLAGLGYWLSLFVPEQELFLQIEHYNRYLTWGGYALAALIVLYIVYHILKTKKK
ncbi:MAG: DedA family protein [Muribaculaceae bacterium]